MGRRFGVATRVHQVVLEDLEAWVQQLDEEFRGHCEWTVRYPPTWSSVKPGVCLEVYTVGVGQARNVIWRGYELVGMTEQGAVEAAMLRLASKALLEAQMDQERAARQQNLF